MLIASMAYSDPDARTLSGDCGDLIASPRTNVVLASLDTAPAVCMVGAERWPS